MNFQHIGIIIAGCIIGFIPFINNIVIFSLGLAKKKYLHALVSMIFFVALVILIAVTNNENESPDYLAILGGLCAIIPMFYTPVAFFRLLVPQAKAEQLRQKSTTSASKANQNFQDIFKEKQNPDIKVYINEDFEDKITRLPLISLIDAKKIVEERMKDGPFTDITDFEERMRFSAVILNKIKPCLDFTINQSSARENTKNIYSREVDF